ncbi:hypothetical protein SK128_009175 [Halocaridina rubra]|uniref:Uncharacterized protein n=1 Tax=Halocaridina rubra TaxID=373956 RepID=A0AAN8XK99_HALRR
MLAVHKNVFWMLLFRVVAVSCTNQISNVHSTSRHHEAFVGKKEAEYIHSDPTNMDNNDEKTTEIRAISDVIRARNKRHESDTKVQDVDMLHIQNEDFHEVKRGNKARNKRQETDTKAQDVDTLHFQNKDFHEVERGNRASKRDRNQLYWRVKHLYDMLSTYPLYYSLLSQKAFQVLVSEVSTLFRNTNQTTSLITQTDSFLYSSNMSFSIPFVRQNETLTNNRTENGLPSTTENIIRLRKNSNLFKIIHKLYHQLLLAEPVVRNATIIIRNALPQENNDENEAMNILQDEFFKLQKNISHLKDFKDPISTTPSYIHSGIHTPSLNISNITNTESGLSYKSPLSRLSKMLYLKEPYAIQTPLRSHGFFRISTPGVITYTQLNNSSSYTLVTENQQQSTSTLMSVSTLMSTMSSSFPNLFSTSSSIHTPSLSSTSSIIPSAHSITYSLSNRIIPSIPDEHSLYAKITSSAYIRLSKSPTSLGYQSYPSISIMPSSSVLSTSSKSPTSLGYQSYPSISIMPSSSILSTSSKSPASLGYQSYPSISIMPSSSISSTSSKSPTSLGYQSNPSISIIPSPSILSSSSTFSTLASIPVSSSAHLLVKKSSSKAIQTTKNVHAPSVSQVLQYKDSKFKPVTINIILRPSTNTTSSLSYTLYNTAITSASVNAISKTQELEVSFTVQKANDILSPVTQVSVVNTHSTLTDTIVNSTEYLHDKFSSEQYISNTRFDTTAINIKFNHLESNKSNNLMPSDTYKKLTTPISLLINSSKSGRINYSSDIMSNTYTTSYQLAKVTKTNSSINNKETPSEYILTIISKIIFPSSVTVLPIINVLGTNTARINNKILTEGLDTFFQVSRTSILNNEGSPLLSAQVPGNLQYGTSVSKLLQIGYPSDWENKSNLSFKDISSNLLVTATIVSTYVFTTYLKSFPVSLILSSSVQSFIIKPSISKGSFTDFTSNYFTFTSSSSFNTFSKKSSSPLDTFSSPFWSGNDNEHKGAKTTTQSKGKMSATMTLSDFTLKKTLLSDKNIQYGLESDSSVVAKRTTSRFVTMQLSPAFQKPHFTTKTETPKLIITSSQIKSRPTSASSKSNAFMTTINPDSQGIHSQQVSNTLPHNGTKILLSLHDDITQKGVQFHSKKSTNRHSSSKVVYSLSLTTHSIKSSSHTTFYQKSTYSTEPEFPKPLLSTLLSPSSTKNFMVPEYTSSVLNSYLHSSHIMKDLNKSLSVNTPLSSEQSITKPISLYSNFVIGSSTNVVLPSYLSVTTKFADEPTITTYESIHNIQTEPDSFQEYTWNLQSSQNPNTSLHQFYHFDNISSHQNNFGLNKLIEFLLHSNNMERNISYSNSDISSDSLNKQFFPLKHSEKPNVIETAPDFIKTAVHNEYRHNLTFNSEYNSNQRLHWHRFNNISNKYHAKNASNMHNIGFPEIMTQLAESSPFLNVTTSNKYSHIIDEVASPILQQMIDNKDINIDNAHLHILRPYEYPKDITMPPDAHNDSLYVTLTSPDSFSNTSNTSGVKYPSFIVLQLEKPNYKNSYLKEHLVSHNHYDTSNIYKLLSVSQNHKLNNLSSFTVSPQVGTTVTPSQLLSDLNLGVYKDEILPLMISRAKNKLYVQNHENNEKYQRSSQSALTKNDNIVVLMEDSQTSIKPHITGQSQRNRSIVALPWYKSGWIGKILSGMSRVKKNTKVNDKHTPILEPKGQKTIYAIPSRKNSTTLEFMQEFKNSKPKYTPHKQLNSTDSFPKHSQYEFRNTNTFNDNISEITNNIHNTTGQHILIKQIVFTNISFPAFKQIYCCPSFNIAYGNLAAFNLTDLVFRRRKSNQIHVKDQASSSNITLLLKRNATEEQVSEPSFGVTSMNISTPKNFPQFFSGATTTIAPLKELFNRISLPFAYETTTLQPIRQMIVKKELSNQHLQVAVSFLSELHDIFNGKQASVAPTLIQNGDLHMSISQFSTLPQNSPNATTDVVHTSSIYHPNSQGMQNIGYPPPYSNYSGSHSQDYPHIINYYPSYLYQVSTYICHGYGVSTNSSTGPCPTASTASVSGGHEGSSATISSGHSASNVPDSELSVTIEKDKGTFVKSQENASTYVSNVRPKPSSISYATLPPALSFEFGSVTTTIPPSKVPHGGYTKVIAALSTLMQYLDKKNNQQDDIEIQNTTVSTTPEDPVLASSYVLHPIRKYLAATSRKVRRAFLDHP